MPIPFIIGGLAVAAGVYVNKNGFDKSMDDFNKGLGYIKDIEEKTEQRKAKRAEDASHDLLMDIFISQESKNGISVVKAEEELSKRNLI